MADIKFTRYEYDKENNKVFFYSDIDSDLTYYIGVSSLVDGKYSDLIITKYAMQKQDKMYALEEDLEALAETLHKNYDDLEENKQDKGNYATLDSDGKVPSSQLPSYVDDVLEYPTKSDFPTKGETGKIYLDVATNIIYRWSGSQYVEISSSLALGETSSTAYAGDKGKALATKVEVLENNAANAVSSANTLKNNFFVFGTDDRNIETRGAYFQTSTSTLNETNDNIVSSDKRIANWANNKFALKGGYAEWSEDDIPSNDEIIIRDASNPNNIKGSGKTLSEIETSISTKLDSTALTSVVKRDKSFSGSKLVQSYGIDTIKETDIDANSVAYWSGDSVFNDEILLRNESDPNAIKGSGMTIEEIVTSINGKQDVLISGTNIKTINGNSILGSGDMTIKSGSNTNITLDNDTGVITISQGE